MADSKKFAKKRTKRKTTSIRSGEIRPGGSTKPKAASEKPNKKKTRNKKRGARRGEAADAAVAVRGAGSGHAGNPARLVVGVGASAGGLAAVGELLAHLPAKADVCLIVVLHLAPSKKSLMAQLLSRASGLVVKQAIGGEPVEAGCIYVLPPGNVIEVEEDRIRLLPRSAETPPHPVDHLLRSLAKHYGSRAVGVVLSGTGHDGTEGLREIGECGGMTFAQEPDTAQHDGMPLSAIHAGVVRMVLPTQQIARQLGARHWNELRVEEDFPVHELDRVFAILRQAVGVDFSQYKRPTLRRRLQRRMNIRKKRMLQEYVALLEAESDEAKQLGEDLLIQVTRFFREPESFEAMTTEALPSILQHKSVEEPIRIWVPGCATGEEVYSIAIAVLELIQHKPQHHLLQIFGTDVSEVAVERARAGVYPVSIEADVSPDRLQRFFMRTEHGYRISPVVREHCIFARQDLTRDPAFSRLDLVVCRNLLIYLQQSAQQRAIRSFHYALRPGGYLLLGESETIGDQASLFSVASKKQKLYVKRAVDTPAQAQTLPMTVVGYPALQRHPVGGQSMASAEAKRILLERYAQPAVIVDSDLQILETVGRTGRYLELAPGTASLSILKMVRAGLAVGLRAAVAECRRQGNTARRTGLRMEGDGATALVDVVVHSIDGPKGPTDRLLVIFEESRESDEARRKDSVESAKTSAAENAGPDQREFESATIQTLREELETTRTHMQTVIQDLEIANQELQSANEEVLSGNEELQSTNEELDTAREELQSTNEEIGTVNDELRGRNEELLNLNSDLENVLSNTQLAILIVSADLRIRRFTPMAERLLNLLETDVGRPIGQIRPNLEMRDLDEHIRAVVNTLEPYEAQVRSSRGHWLLLSIRPYKDIENRIDGAVLSLMDVTQLKEAELEARAARDFANAIIDAVEDPLLVLDRDVRIIRMNRSFSETFNIKIDDALGLFLWDLGSGEWDTPALRELLHRMLAQRGETESQLSERQRLSIGSSQRIKACRVEPDGHPPRILLVIHPASSAG